jgi:hypothetical protein
MAGSAPTTTSSPASVREARWRGQHAYWNSNLSAFALRPPQRTNASVRFARRVVSASASALGVQRGSRTHGCARASSRALGLLDGRRFDHAKRGEHLR